jgi:predicted MFS family arabinose efflux permease
MSAAIRYGTTVSDQPTGQSLDHGRAWLDMALAALSMFTVFATAYSFGTFVRPMSAEFHAGRGATSIVFAITAFLYFGLGAITGPLVHKTGPRKMIIFGGVVQVGGMLLTSHAHALWQAYVAYGIGVGIGVSCGYVPMVAVVGGWFERKRATAIGVAVSGIGVSSLVGAPLAARLIKAYGWRHAYQLFAIGTAILLSVVAMFIRMPASFRAAPSFSLSSAVRTKTFGVMFASLFLVSVTLFNVFVNIVPYAEENGIAKVRAATLLSILGGASILGRNALAWVARRAGALNTFTGAVFVMGSTQVLWLFADGRYAVLAVFVAVFGVGYGGLIALGPIALAELFGAEQLGGLAGVNYTAAGLGALSGPTFCSWLVDRTGGYTASSLVGLGFGLAGFAVLLLIRPKRER